MPTQDELARELLESVPPLMWFVRSHMRKHRAGLSLAQFRTLVRLDQDPEAGVSDVADHVGVSKPTASRVLAGLVIRQLVRREDDPVDRRRVALSLTTKGHAVLLSSRGHAQANLAAELKSFSAIDRQRISAAMGLLQTRFGTVSGLGSGPFAKKIGKRKSG